MITEVLDYLKNHFIYIDTNGNINFENIELVFEATGKTITADFQNTYLVGQYINITDSILNDGVYKISVVATGVLTVEEDLINETATPFIFALAIPKALITLISEINTWVTRNRGKSGISSEKIDDYSISYGSSMQSGGWKSAFGTVPRIPMCLMVLSSIPAP